MEQQFVLPELFCPFPSAVNLSRDAVQRHVVAWATHFGLVRHEAAMTRFRAAKFGWLAARAYPLADRDELALVADWNVWLFMLDDQCDESGLGKDPERLRQVFADLLATLAQPSHAAAAAAPESLLARSLCDLWRRMTERSTFAWQARFLADLRDYCDACVWEAMNRARGAPPTTADYIAHRPLTGGLITDIDLIDLTEHITLPPAVREHAAIARMTSMANNVVCWSNDIFSLRKELQRGDFHNLVLLTQREQRCSLPQAVEIVAALHDDEARGFLALEKTLPDWGVAVNHDLRKYVAVLRAWMRGNMDWARETGRYAQSGGASAAQPATYLEAIIGDASSNA